MRQIDADSVGNSYSQVFGKYLDERVTNVEVLDPYIRSSHQVYFIKHFLNLNVILDYIILDHKFCEIL